MPDVSQSRAVASIAHKDYVSFARPFHDPDSDAITVEVNTVTNIGKVERATPGDWRVGNVVPSTDSRRATIQLFPD